MIRPIYFISKSNTRIRILYDDMRAIVFDNGIEVLMDACDDNDDLMLHEFTEGSTNIKLFSSENYDYIQRNGVTTILDGKTFHRVAAGRFVLVKSGTTNQLYSLDVIEMVHVIVSNNVFDLSDRGLTLSRGLTGIECKNRSNHKVRLPYKANYKKYVVDGNKVLVVSNDVLSTQRGYAIIINNGAIRSMKYKT